MKVRTTVTIQVTEDGNVNMRVEGQAGMADLILAAAYLTLEQQHQFNRFKMAQAINEQRRVVPVAGIPDLSHINNGKG